LDHCTLSSKDLLSSLCSMRVKNLLDISLLQTWKSFSWNFMGEYEDDPYFVLLVGEVLYVINCFRSKLPLAANQSYRVQTFPGLLRIYHSASCAIKFPPFTNTNKGLHLTCIQGMTEGAVSWLLKDMMFPCWVAAEVKWCSLISGYLNGEEQDLQMLCRNYQKHSRPWILDSWTSDAIKPQGQGQYWNNAAVTASSTKPPITAQKHWKRPDVLCLYSLRT